MTRAYDADGNLHTITDWLNNATTFDYDADSNLTAITRPNGTSAAYSYDHNQQVGSIDDATGTLSYGRSDEGLLASGPLSGQTGQAFGYDGVKRLTSADATAYAYDAADNLTQTLDGTGQTVQQAYDDANEVTRVTQGTTTLRTFGYDREGNRFTHNENGVLSVYTYDQANQLIGYDGTDARQPAEQVSSQYVYDATGLRQNKTVNNILTGEVYDLAQGMPLMIEDGSTAYITGPDDLPIEQIAADGTVRYFSHDQLGSTTALTDSAGSTVAAYSYDAYGNTTATGTVTNPFQYAGQYTDAETGLQYLRARYYDASTGQMLSRDPIFETTREPYAYANGNPLNIVDPTGLDGFLGTGIGPDVSWRDVGRGTTDLVAVVPYGVYYVSNRAGHAINLLGSQLGPVGSAGSHVLTLAMAAPQAAGLGGDAAVDAFKNWAFGHESICDEGKVGYLNPLHSFLPGGLKGPQTYLPGIHPGGHIDFEW